MCQLVAKVKYTRFVYKSIYDLCIEPKYVKMVGYDINYYKYWSCFMVVMILFDTFAENK